MIWLFYFLFKEKITRDDSSITEFFRRTNP